MLERLLETRAVEYQLFEFSPGEGLLRWLENHKGELDLVFLDIEMGELYYEGLQRQQSQLRILRHDLRNHLIALQGMLANENVEQAQSYLNELTNSPAFEEYDVFANF